jgi:hypothetical protein
MDTNIATIGAFFALAAPSVGAARFHAWQRAQRAERYLQLRERFRANDRLVRTATLLDSGDETKLATLKWSDRREFLGFLEDVDLMVNNGGFSREVAYCVFGFYALRASESEAFMRGIDADSPYWAQLFGFVNDMRKMEASPPRHPIRL